MSSRTPPRPAASGSHAPRLLSLQEAAAHLTIGVRTLKAVVARGDLQVVQVAPRRVAVRIEDLDAYVQSRLR